MGGLNTSVMAWAPGRAWDPAPLPPVPQPAYPDACSAGGSSDGSASRAQEASAVGGMLPQPASAPQGARPPNGIAGAEAESADAGSAEACATTETAGFDWLRAAVWEPVRVDQLKLRTVTYKFDAWVEMAVGPRATPLQPRLPGQLLEFGQVAAGAAEAANTAGGNTARMEVASTGELPPTARLVTFPLEPKPHKALHVDWVKFNWVE